MKNIEQKKDLLWFRDIVLESLLISSREYQRTKDTRFLEHIKYYADLSANLKNQISLL